MSNAARSFLFFCQNNAKSLFLIVTFGFLCVYRLRRPLLSGRKSPMDAAPEVVSTSSEQGIKFLSWNLWCHHVVGGSDWATRLANFITKVKEVKPHIICLQEVFSSQLFFLTFSNERDFLCEEMSRLGYQHIIPPSSQPKIYGSNSGLACFILRHSVSYIDDEEVLWDNTEEYICNKGFHRIVLKVNVDKDGSERTEMFEIFNCHFDAHRWDVKQSQIAQLSIATETLPDKTIKSLLVTGDFNICQQHLWDDGAMYRTLLAGLAKNGFADNFGDEASISFPKENVCYDHIFSKTSSIETVGTRILSNGGQDKTKLISDHNGFLLTFLFKE